MTFTMKVGDVFPTNEGGSVTIIEYKKWNHVVIKHNDCHGHISIAQSGHIKRGTVKNPYHKSVFGVGFVGHGSYSPSFMGKDTKIYARWRNMLMRCYDKSCQKKYPTYIGCSVSDEWHNFQNFAEWCESQPNAQADGFQLDKDLTIAGNKVYSPSACSFVSREINCLLNDHGAARGMYPQGVSMDKRSGKLVAQINIDGKVTKIGWYSDPDEAHKAYKAVKEEHVRRMAKKHKAELSQEVYKSLMSYVV